MARFDDLLGSYVDADSDEIRADIEALIWREFGHEQAVLVLDMSRFSLWTQRFGVVHYLSMVKRMQVVTAPVVDRHRGTVVKFEADNCFARFDDPADAIRAAIAVNYAIQGMNIITPEEFDIDISCGVDFGKFLLVEGTDYWGQPVNRASKLGEDLAEPGEILVTSDAMERVDGGAGIRTEPVQYSISGIALEAFKVVY